MCPPAVVHCSWLTHCWLIVEWMRNGNTSRSRNFILNEESSQSVKKSLFAPISNDHSINKFPLDSSWGKPRELLIALNHVLESWKERLLQKRQESNEVEEVKWIERKLGLFYTNRLSVWHSSFSLYPLFLSLPLPLIELPSLHLFVLLTSLISSLLSHSDKHGHETTRGDWIRSNCGSLLSLMGEISRNSWIQSLILAEIGPSAQTEKEAENDQRSRRSSINVSFTSDQWDGTLIFYDTLWNSEMMIENKIKNCIWLNYWLMRGSSILSLLSTISSLIHKTNDLILPRFYLQSVVFLTINSVIFHGSGKSDREWEKIRLKFCFPVSLETENRWNPLWSDQTEQTLSGWSQVECIWYGKWAERNLLRSNTRIHNHFSVRCDPIPIIFKTEKNLIVFN